MARFLVILLDLDFWVDEFERKEARKVRPFRDDAPSPDVTRSVANVEA